MTNGRRRTGHRRAIFLAKLALANRSEPYIRFRVPAEDSQRAGRTFAGLVFARQRKVSFGEAVGDLELVAKATDHPIFRRKALQPRT